MVAVDSYQVAQREAPMNTNFTVGQVVMFGRPNGEKTRGKIVDINMKSVTVITTEDRGKTKAGVKWRVAPSLVTPIDGAQVSVPTLPSISNSEDSAISNIIRTLDNRVIEVGAQRFNASHLADKIGLQALLRAAYAAGQRDYRNALVGN